MTEEKYQQFNITLPVSGELVSVQARNYREAVKQAADMATQSEAHQMLETLEKAEGAAVAVLERCKASPQLYRHFYGNPVRLAGFMAEMQAAEQQGLGADAQNEIQSRYELEALTTPEDRQDYPLRKWGGGTIQAEREDPLAETFRLRARHSGQRFIPNPAAPQTFPSDGTLGSVSLQKQVELGVIDRHVNNESGAGWEAHLAPEQTSLQAKMIMRSPHLSPEEKQRALSALGPDAW